MHEKEMFAVVHCLKLRPHHLSLHKSIVYTNNVSQGFKEITEDHAQAIEVGGWLCVTSSWFRNWLRQCGV